MDLVQVHGHAIEESSWRCQRLGVKISACANKVCFYRTRTNIPVTPPMLPRTTVSYDVRRRPTLCRIRNFRQFQSCLETT
jgi:hypothetical protein